MVVFTIVSEDRWDCGSTHNCVRGKVGSWYYSQLSKRTGGIVVLLTIAPQRGANLFLWPHFCQKPHENGKNGKGPRPLDRTTSSCKVQSFAGTNLFICKDLWFFCNRINLWLKKVHMNSCNLLSILYAERVSTDLVSDLDPFPIVSVWYRNLCPSPSPNPAVEIKTFDTFVYL